MSDHWSDVDALLRRVGALRTAADDGRTSAQNRAAIEDAIARAAQAIDETIDTKDGKALADAHAALIEAEDLVARAVKGRTG